MSKKFDIQLQEVEAKRHLNGTSKVNTQTRTHTNRQTHTQTDKHTYRQTTTHTNRQTYGQINLEKSLAQRKVGMHMPIYFVINNMAFDLDNVNDNVHFVPPLCHNR